MHEFADFRVDFIFVEEEYACGRHIGGVLQRSMRPGDVVHVASSGGKIARAKTQSERPLTMHTPPEPRQIQPNSAS